MSAGDGSGEGNRAGGKDKGGGRKGGKGNKNRVRVDASGQKHTHAGGSAAVLGAHLARYLSIQGGSLVLSNLLHAAAVVYVARRLGPSDLGTYSLLLFLSGLITQVFHLFSKPGTLRRVFGQADDDDAGAEGDFDQGEDEETSDSPEKSLGVGIVWVALLGLIGGGLTILLRTQIAGWLLGDPGQADLIFWAGILGGVGAIFKLSEIVIWFERRPFTFVFVDALRPTLNLILMAYFISNGMGVKGAIMGAAIGTSVATALSIVPLLSSFRPGFELREVKLIVQRGFGRIPIAMSMWTIQNADSFVLSRFVSHRDVGYYQLAQKLGLIVAFLPQGFRIALRPLRKSAMFQAVRDQYGSAVAKGQLLAYFCLLSIVAILAMELAGELIINQASPRFQAAAPIVPLTAASMTMPALFRTINGQAFFPHKRAWFIGSVIFAALSFIGWMVVLVPLIGIAGTPVAAILGFGVSCAFLFIRGQRGKSPIRFPYSAIAKAVLMATVIALGFHFAHPANKWLQLVTITLLMLLFIALLFVTRVIPRYHRGPLLHVARSAFRRAPHGFNRSRALRALPPRERRQLRSAICDRLPAEALAAESSAAAGAASANGDSANGAGGDGSRPEQLVAMLRRVGERGGVPVGEKTPYDARIASFLFADTPIAARTKTMRGLVSAGADSNDLRALEELSDYLAKTPDHAWKGKPGKRGRLGRA